MDKDKQKNLDIALKKINKQFGEGTVTTAAEASEKLAKRIIKTPSIELNKALYGGVGGIVEVYGPESSGKTSLCIETLANAQLEDPNFVGAWLETEHSVTKDILEDHGVDLNRLVYWEQEDTGNAESSLDIIRSLVNSGAVDMIILNSVAGLAPKTETEDDLEKQNMALTARLLSKFFRVITGPLGKNHITMFVINQVRDKVGVMFGLTETTSGGRALAFYSSVRIRVSKLKLQAADPIKETEGLKVHCKVWKNRFAGKHNPYTECDYYARYESGIDNIIAMPQLLLDANIVRQSGAYWYYEDENGQPFNIGGIECKFRSKSDFLDSIRNNDILRETLENELNGIKPKSVSAEEIDAINQQKANIERAMAENGELDGAEE